MSIRFKFRSSVNFDTIEIDGDKPYISVGQLRSKILRQKKLNGICHKDFDLVFLDDLTGQEYNDDEFKIPSGSSVIIKRVPAEPVPLAMLRHHKLEASELSEDIPKGMDHNKPEEIVLEKKLSPEDGEQMKLEKVANMNGINLQKVDLPSELRCPICNTYFKKAVMIPCCQHSFCEKCICDVLSLKAKCPKCSSTKYRVEHLLPNLSLRHAIEHFLESQILATSPGNDLQKYVPDGESGIQGKEVSTVTKRKLDMLYSTPLLNRNGGRDANEDLTPSVDSQGENQPVTPQVCIPYEADSTSRKRGPWINPGGGDRSYAVDNRNKTAGRTCYMCGSPCHFIRDCPMASTEQPMFHGGDHMYQAGVSAYPMPYWNTPAFPPVNPYMNMYGNPGMVPYSPNIVPLTPYGVPPYVASTYGNLPLPSGSTRMGGIVGPRTEQPTRRSDSDNRMKRQRSPDYEDDGNHKRHHDLERSSEYKSHRDRGKALSNSEESHSRRLYKSSHGRYEKHSHSTNDRSISGVEDLHSGNHRYDETRHKKYYHQHQRHHLNDSDSDCSCSRHQIKKRKESYEEEYYHSKRKRVH